MFIWIHTIYGSKRLWYYSLDWIMRAYVYYIFIQLCSVYRVFDESLSSTIIQICLGKKCIQTILLNLISQNNHYHTFLKYLLLLS